MITDTVHVQIRINVQSGQVIACEVQLDTFSRFSAIYYKGKKFYDFLFSCTLP